MPNRRLVATLAFATAFLANFAHAQVHRCQDASGRLVYSDRPCNQGQQGEQIERRKSQAEIAREREQAYNAELHKQQRNMAERQREAIEQSNRSLTYQRSPAAPQGGGWAERKARENAATSAGSIAKNGSTWDREAEAQRARELQEQNRVRAEQEARAQAESEASRQQMPRKLQSCLGDTCRDSQGGTYTRSASDRNLLIGNQGQRCRRSDPSQSWRCD